MFLAAGYFDESSDNELEERCFTVAGYVAAGAPAVVLDLRWKALLREYDISYFKASELDNGFGEFLKFRDDPKGDVLARFSEREKVLFREIKTRFVDLICGEDGLIAISATCILRDWNLLRLEHPELIAKLPPMYQLCGHLVMLEAGFMMSDTNAANRPENRGLLRPVFDSHKEYSARFILSFDTFCQKNPIASKHLLPPIFEDDKTYHCIQAADLLAYEIRRIVGNETFDDVKRFRIAMQRLAPQVSTVYVLNYRALKLLAGRQRPDSIPIEPAFQQIPAMGVRFTDRT